MTANGLEVIRARWLAASKAAFRVVIGNETIEVARDGAYNLKIVQATGSPPVGTQAAPALSPAPWTAVVGIVFDRGPDTGGGTVRREFVEIDRIASAWIDE
jgi:hypothetical protein